MREEKSEEERSLELYPDKDRLHPARLVFSPGPEYGPQTRRWQGIPGIERAANGRLWATWYSGTDGEGPGNYDYNRGDRWAEGDDREILMATFTEEDILAGRCVSAQARLRQVVNKIPGDRCQC